MALGKEASNRGPDCQERCRSNSSAMGRLLDGLARRFVGGVDLEVLDGLQGFAVRTIVELVQTRQAEKQAFELVELPEKYPVWHQAPTTDSLIRQVN